MQRRLFSLVYFRTARWCALLIGCATPLAPIAQADSPTLDLSGYRLTLDENFKTLNISALGPGTAWIAHTPWNGDFGTAAFDNPGPDGPFSLNAQGLKITARK